MNVTTKRMIAAAVAGGWVMLAFYLFGVDLSARGEYLGMAFVLSSLCAVFATAYPFDDTAA